MCKLRINCYPHSKVQKVPWCFDIQCLMKMQKLWISFFAIMLFGAQWNYIIVILYVFLLFCRNESMVV